MIIDPVAATGVFVSLATGAVALVTYRAVQDQLVLANKQLQLAEQELNVVKDDLDISRIVLAATEAQMKEINRRPSLRICAIDGTDVIKGVVYDENAVFNVALINSGGRTSTNIQVVVSLPGMMTPDGMRAFPTEIGGKTFYQQTNDLGPATLYPNKIPRQSYQLYAHTSSGRYDVYYRIYDDFGAHPDPDEPWGKVQFET